jgi:hypothetical protein
MKKNRLLHETDLARMALLSRDEKRTRLRQVRDFIPKHSWTPVRSALPGIFQAQKSLLVLPGVTWTDVENAIRAKCRKHPTWAESNLELARLIFDYVSNTKLKSVEWSFGPLPVGFATSVKFWPEFYSIEEERPLILYADPRRGHGLTRLARKFVFSTMHQHIARDDFGDARFKIADFPVNEDDGSRRIRFFEMNADDLIDVDALNADIQETYQLWFEILDEREREAKRAAPGPGGMFGV